MQHFARGARAPVYPQINGRMLTCLRANKRMLVYLLVNGRPPRAGGLGALVRTLVRLVGRGDVEADTPRSDPRVGTVASCLHAVTYPCHMETGFV